ncbi:MAG: D-Ala-D-Ala carboxypeptidase family metallohydrolase [Gemmatimonadaceae bacterium]
MIPSIFRPPAALAVAAVAAVILIGACRDATVPEVIGPETTVIARRAGPSHELTTENSEWKRRFEADSGTDCYTRRFNEADTLRVDYGLNSPACASQMVVTPNPGDGTYSLWHSPTAVDGNGSSDSLVVTFSRPVGRLAILRDGTHSCYDTTIGQVVAYGPGNVELERQPFTLIQTCSDALPMLREAPTAASQGAPAAASAPYTSPYAAFAEAVLQVPAGVTRLVFLPPEEWKFTFVDPYFPSDSQALVRQGTYSLIFRADAEQPLPAVEILSAGGPNDGGSFITRATDRPENVISLRARVTPAAFADSVTWEVTGMPLHDAFNTIVPDTMPRGTAASFVVPTSNRSRVRWPVAGRVPHDPLTAAQKASDLTKKSLGFRIVAKVTDNGLTVRSQPVTVQQDERDIMREEYVEFGQDRILARAEFGTLGDSLRNLTGDYTLWPSGPRLIEKMPIMQQLAVRRFGRPITVMSGYRNPVHHFLHAGATAVNSQHLYGLATDWEIVNARARPAGYSVREYFDEIKKLTRHSAVDGCWEPDSVIVRTSSRVPAQRSLNHAHTDWRAMNLCASTWQ